MHQDSQQHLAASSLSGPVLGQPLEAPALLADGDKTAPESRSHRRGWRLRPWQLILMPVLLILLIIVALVIGESFVEPQITVSRVTTYFVEPLDDKGHVDYAEALNRKGSAGVTPENNAAVLLARAVNPALISEEVRAKNREYQIEFPRPGEVCFTQFTGKDASKELERTLPWTADHNPALAAWVETQEAHFDLAVEASKRTRFFEPLCGQLLTSPEGMHGSISDLRDGIGCRAALRLGQGDAAAAWDDLLAMHRLSRLVGARQSTLSVLIALGLHRRAVDGTLVLVRSPLLTRQLLQQMQFDLRNLAPLPRIIDTHEHERCQFLELSQTVFRWRAHANLIHMWQGADEVAYKVPFSFTRRVFNIEDVLKRANEWHDRWQRIAAIPSRVAQRVELQLFLDDLRHAPCNSWAEAGLHGSRAMADSQMNSFGSQSLGFKSDERASARCIVLQALLATRLFQMRHGTDPAKVEDLDPDFMSEPPIDPFTELPLKYTHVDGEIRIYSVWLNGVDDGGVRTLPPVSTAGPGLAMAPINPVESRTPVEPNIGNVRTDGEATEDFSATLPAIQSGTSKQEQNAPNRE